MGCFQVRYGTRVVIYDRKLFIRLATGYLTLVKTVVGLVVGRQTIDHRVLLNIPYKESF